jgi:hypothetical protein
MKNVPNCQNGKAKQLRRLTGCPRPRKVFQDGAGLNLCFLRGDVLLAA